MNIVQINSLSDKGGAAKIARRLQLEFKRLGNDSKMIVGRKKFKNIPDPDIQELAQNRFLSTINYRFRLHDLIFPTYYKYKNSAFFKNAGIVHYHNLHGSYFSILALPRLTKLKRSVWTLHDPWIAYDEKSTPEFEGIFKENFIFKKIKRWAINASEIDIVVPSIWLKEIVQKKFPNKKIWLIRHGIDIDVFKKTDKKEARTKLGLPADKKIVLFLANSGGNNKYKGWDYIENIIRLLEKDTTVLFLCLGGKGSDANSKSNIKFVDYVFDEAVLAQYYSAADLLLFPTLAETFGLVAVEAMACGLPVVSFRIGGVSETIIHQKTGYIANYKDADDLYMGVKYILNLEQSQLEEMSDFSAKTAKEQYSLKRMIDQYLELYKKILAR